MAEAGGMNGGPFRPGPRGPVGEGSAGGKRAEAALAYAVGVVGWGAAVELSSLSRGGGGLRLYGGGGVEGFPSSPVGV